MAPPTIKNAEELSTTTSKGESKVEKLTIDTRTMIRTGNIDDITKRNETTLLLRLPRELRDMIYGYAIGGNEISTMHSNVDDSSFIIIASTYNEEDETEAKWNALFSLSLVCRKLRDETRLLPWTLNVLEIALGTLSSSFLQTLKKEFKEAIATVSFGFKHYHNSIPEFLFNYTVPTALNDCKNLKRVIAKRTLHPVQIALVKQFAQERTLTYIEEEECLPYGPILVVGCRGSMHDDEYDSEDDDEHGSEDDDEHGSENDDEHGSEDDDKDGSEDD